MMRRTALPAALALVFACTAPPASVSRHTLPELQPGDADPARGFEALPVRQASELLAPELLAGRHHRVEELVGSDGFLHLYRVASELGELEVAGDELLRQRVRELEAIGALRGLQDEAFAAAIARAEERPFLARWRLGSEPSDTALGMPDAAWQELLAADATTSEARGADAHAALREYVRFEREKRRLAARLGVDPHAHSPALQRELNRVAIALFAGGFAHGRVPARVSREKGIELPFVDEDRRLAMLLDRDSPEDLVRWNRIELAMLGLSPEQAAAVEAHPWLTDRHNAILLGSLAALDGVPGRAALVEAALGARSETDALVYQRIAELLRGIHERVGRIERIGGDGRFVRAYLAGGVRVTPVEVDELFWTAPTARLVERGAGPDPSGAALVRRELWLTGSASPRARAEIEARGFVLVERAFAHLDALEAAR